MSKSDYTQINLNRQSNYIIVISPKNERNAFEKTIMIANEYIKKIGKPKVIIISQNYKNDKLKKISHSQVQTFKAGTIRLIDRNSEPDDFKVIEKAAPLLKNAMIILDDSFNYTNEVANMLLSIKGKAHDYVIHRSEIKLIDAEIDYIRKEFIKIENYTGEGSYVPEKNIIFRLHDSPQFPITVETLISLIDEFGEIHGFNILLAYFVSRKRTILFTQELVSICKNEGQKPADYINPHEYKRQTKNYVYYNLISGRIMDTDIPFIEKCAKGLAIILQKSQQKTES